MTAPSGTTRRKRRTKIDEDLTQEKVTSSFLVCPRCSYFLSGYKLINDDFTQAVEGSTDGWLDLKWNHQTRLHIYKSFGYRIDEDTLRYEGLCRDCQRVFMIGKPDGDETAPYFRIEIIPG
jgi:hypothetical protein